MEERPSVAIDESDEKWPEFCMLEENICGAGGLSSWRLAPLPTEEGGGDELRDAPTVPWGEESTGAGAWSCSADCCAWL